MRKTVKFVVICSILFISAVSCTKPKKPAGYSSLTSDEKRAIEKQKIVMDEIMGYYAREALERPKDIVACVREMFAMRRSGKCRDKYSNYFAPERVERRKEDMAGKFRGVGLEITKKDGQIVVINVIAEMPAARAGIQAGDIIIKINGKEPITVWEATNLLRGKRNTKVELAVFRVKIKKEINFILKREVITASTVKWRLSSLDKEVGIVEIHSFDGTVLKKFPDAIIDLMKKGAKGIIFDLRDNLGGYLDGTLSLLAFFARVDDTILTIRYRNTKKTITFYTLPKEAAVNYLAACTKIFIALRNTSDLKKINTIILVNNGSASASEIFAGTMKDWGYPIVGEKTYGKGVGQVAWHLSDGSLFTLTTFEFLAGNGKVVIRDKGVEPTFIVKAPETKASRIEKDDNKDTQLKKAVEVLQTCNKIDPARAYKCKR